VETIVPDSHRSTTDNQSAVTPRDLKEYTLVLDLDETLVHCKYNESGSVVHFRPYLDDFLAAMVPLYNIVIFTAAAQDYADLVLDNIDPQRAIFSKRLYRQHTKNVNEEYNIKDLLIVTDNLEKTLIIDNIPENFMRQKNNGIFIKSWFDDQEDRELKRLIPLLKQIVDQKVPDVREFLQGLRNKLIEEIQRGSINPTMI